MAQGQQFEDASKKCKDCGGVFTVTSGEQEWLYEKFGADFSVPVRCKPCRKLKKERNAAR